MKRPAAAVSGPYFPATNLSNTDRSINLRRPAWPVGVGCSKDGNLAGWGGSVL